MKNSWKDIWEQRRSDIDRPTHDILFKANGYDGQQSIITPETINPALLQYEKIMGVETNDTFYEVGCGAGAVLYYWHMKGYKVSGCDLSEGLINVARKAIPEGSWEVLEADRISIKPKYDHVLAFGVFFYFPDYDYAKEVLYRMIMKGKKSVSVFDIPDLAKKEDSENFRKMYIPDYNKKYKGMSHLYFPKSWWETIGNELGLKVNTYDQIIKGYESGSFRYNITISL